MRSKKIFKSYEAKQHKEMMSVLSNINAEQFSQITLEEMTLIHHVAFDANLEVLEMLKSLPYYSEIVDLDNNEVSKPTLLTHGRWGGRRYCGRRLGAR
jgi:hypothetical protein